VWAYHEIVESGMVGRLQAMYLSVFVDAYPAPQTVNQIIDRFAARFHHEPYTTHHGFGSRISELTEMGFLRKVDQVKCEQSQKIVNRWVWTERTAPLASREESVSCEKCCGTGQRVKKIYYDPNAQPELFS